MYGVGRAKQRGVAALLVAAILGIGICAFIVTALNSAVLNEATLVRNRNAEAQSRAVEGVHLLCKPRDGRFFLLADELPDKLGARYRWWSWAHMIVFLGAGSAGVIML